MQKHIQSRQFVEVADKRYIPFVLVEEYEAGIKTGEIMLEVCMNAPEKLKGLRKKDEELVIVRNTRPRSYITKYEKSDSGELNSYSFLYDQKKAIVFDQKEAAWLIRSLSSWDDVTYRAVSLKEMKSLQYAIYCSSDGYYIEKSSKCRVYFSNEARAKKFKTEDEAKKYINQLLNKGLTGKYEVKKIV